MQIPERLLHGLHSVRPAQPFRERPAEFLLAAPRYRISPQEVQVASGAAVLLRYLSDDGLERLTLAWNAQDRVYFLTGFLTEAEALAFANSMNR